MQGERMPSAGRPAPPARRGLLRNYLAAGAVPVAGETRSITGRTGGKSGESREDGVNDEKLSVGFIKQFAEHGAEFPP